MQEFNETCELNKRVEVYWKDNSNRYGIVDCERRWMYSTYRKMFTMHLASCENLYHILEEQLLKSDVWISSLNPIFGALNWEPETHSPLVSQSVTSCINGKCDMQSDVNWILGALCSTIKWLAWNYMNTREIAKSKLNDTEMQVGVQMFP